MAGAEVNTERLRPPEPTPADEMCACGGAPPLLLMSLAGLAYNPLFCLLCKGEVDPAGLGLDQADVDAVADWRAEYGAIDALELASGPYEGWAQKELADPASAANRSAFALVERLARHRPCYFNFWQGDETYASCPVGGEPLVEVRGARHSVATCQVHPVAVLGAP